MKAMGLDQFGGPEAVRLMELPDPARTRRTDMATSTDLRAAIEEVQQQLPAEQAGGEGVEAGASSEDWASSLAPVG